MGDGEVGTTSIFCGDIAEKRFCALLKLQGALPAGRCDRDEVGHPRIQQRPLKLFPGPPLPITKVNLRQPGIHLPHCLRNEMFRQSPTPLHRTGMIMSNLRRQLFSQRFGLLFKGLSQRYLRATSVAVTRLLHRLGVPDEKKPGHAANLQTARKVR